MRDFSCRVLDVINVLIGVLIVLGFGFGILVAISSPDDKLAILGGTLGFSVGGLLIHLICLVSLNYIFRLNYFSSLAIKYKQFKERRKD